MAVNLDTIKPFIEALAKEFLSELEAMAPALWASFDQTTLAHLESAIADAAADKALTYFDPENAAHHQSNYAYAMLSIKSNIAYAEMFTVSTMQRLEAASAAWLAKTLLGFAIQKAV